MAPSALRRTLFIALAAMFLITGNNFARMMDNGVDPANLGKGEWIYVLKQALAGMNGNVPSITNTASMMTYLKNRGVEHIIVKAGEGHLEYAPPGDPPQFTASLVNAAHAAGLKIFGYTRSYGTNVPGEIALAANVYNMGADGFVIDAEVEWETRNLADNFNKALQLGSGIKAQFPTKFLGHSPFPYISLHSSFPYKEFGLYCDAVMPQAYWNDISIVNCSPSQMATDLSTQWRNWQNSLTGNWTNAIKPICVAAPGWNADCTVSGAQIIEFVDALKADPNPATKGGYHGINYWRAELHTADMWNGVRDGDIGTAPVILVQPRGLTVTNVTPTNVTMTVEVVGANPLSYQWRFNGVNIAGATNWFHTMNSVQFTNGGTYSVVITNRLGTKTSSNAVLTVRAAPRISSQPLPQTVVLGNNATFSVVANGTTPLTYQWKFKGTNIAGATASTYTRNAAQLVHDGNYSVGITNNYGGIVSSNALLHVVTSEIPPVITLQPQSQTLLAGNNFVLAAAAAGTGPLAYQWRKEGTNISGATGSTLTITNAQAGHGGDYTVLASNSAGFETSLTAVVAVNYALNLSISGSGFVTKTPELSSYPPGTVVTLTPSLSFTGWSGDITGTANPRNVTMSGHRNITATFTGIEVILDNESPGVTYNTAWVAATSSADKYSTNYRYATASAVGAPTRTATYTPTLPYDGRYEVSVWYPEGGNRTTQAPHITTYNGGVVTNALNQQSNGGDWRTVTSRLFLAGTTGNVRIQNDTGDSPLIIVADAMRFAYQPTPQITTQPASQSALVGSDVTFTANISGATSYQWRRNGTSISGATNSTYTRTNLVTTDAGNYTVRAFNTAGNSTSSNGVLTVYAVPAITTQPLSQTNNQGGTVTFAVIAFGTTPFTYEWRHDNETISGANASTLVLNDLQPADAGDYTAIVRNIAGAAVSTSAKLSVRLPPTINNHPDDQTINEGASATFSVSASGEGPLSYQWLKDGDPFPGTGSSLTLNNCTPDANGFYSVIVSNVAGSVTSDAASLTVNPMPRQFQSVTTASNSIQMIFSGPVGSTNIIQVSTNLVQWDNFTNLINSNGTVQFSDTVTNRPHRFYRSKSP